MLLIFQGVQNRRKLWRNMDRCKDSIYQILAPTLSSSTAWQVVRRRTSRSPTISLHFLHAKHTLAIAGTGQHLKSPHPPQLVTAPLTAPPMLYLCKFSDASVGRGHVIVSVSVSTVLGTKMMVERSGIQTLGGGAVDGGAKERDVDERGGSRRLTLLERASRWGGCNPPLPKTLTCYALLCNILHKTAI